MTLIFLVESVFELVILLICLILLNTVRKKYLDDLIIKSVKAKKLIGFAMISVSMVIVLNYSYIMFRYLYPPNPYTLLNVDPNSFNTCTTTLK